MYPDSPNEPYKQHRQDGFKGKEAAGTPGAGAHT